MSPGRHRAWLVGAGVAAALTLHALVLHHVVIRGALPAMATLGIGVVAAVKHVGVFAALYRRFRQKLR